MNDPALELDRAIADAAVLAMRLEKYRRGREADVSRLRATLAQLGAEARRSHRLGAGDAPFVDLARRARAIAGALERILAGILAGPEYREAVAAYRRGDDDTLRPLLFSIFADLDAAPRLAEVYAPIAWTGRRGPLAADDVADLLDQIRATGLAAEEDADAPGADPDMPAVSLRRNWPDGAPIALAYPGDAIGPACLAGASGRILLHRPVLRAPFTVVLQLARNCVDEWVADPKAYAALLAPVLEARGHRVRRVSTPATS